MASSENSYVHLQPLNTRWSNSRSRSSLASTSDASTFHSAHGYTSYQNMELQSLAQTTSSHPISATQLPPSPTISSIKMVRQDSGYSDTPILPSHSRPTSTTPSTSSTRRSSPSKSKRRSHTSTSSISRPSTKRASRSSPQTSQLPVRLSSSRPRPGLQTRHTSPFQQQATFQFFQFPSLESPLAPEQDPDVAAPIPPPPPTTIQYWTSDSTRRLEYAAIDAASRGVKGFLIKLVPNCILPKTSRSGVRSRFCEGDEGSDAGSVRRYRLELPEEKEGLRVNADECRKRPATGIQRRWTMFGKGSS